MKIFQFFSRFRLALALGLLLAPTPVQAGEINLKGNGVKISNNDITPSNSDHTFFGVITARDGQTLSRTFTIENTAPAFFDLLYLTGSPPVQVVGAHSSEFKVTQPPSEILNGGFPGSMTFTVTYIPGIGSGTVSSGGIRNATISIANDDPDGDENPYTFAIQATVKFNLKYITGANGSLIGAPTQNVWQNGTAVTVVPDPGYYFVGWSDGSTANPRTDMAVTSDLKVSANYLSYSSTGTEISITGREDLPFRGDLVIPASIDGLPVTSIGKNALSWGWMTSVTIPPSVTSIGEGAFAVCTQLPSVMIPAGVTSIGASTFSGCSSLTSVTIPNSVTRIGDDAFWRCTSLTGVTIPEGVTSIGDYAFSDCASLETMIFEGDAPSIGIEVFRGTPSLELSVVDPYAAGFSRWSLGGKPVSGLSPLLFESTDTEVTITGCRSSETGDLVVPGAIHGLPVTMIGSSAFWGQRSLTTISLPEGVTGIGNDAFVGCVNLTTVTIPEGVTWIGSTAFRDCGSLTSLTIPASATWVGSQTFLNCWSLKSIVLEGNAPRQHNLFYNTPSDVSVIVTDPAASGYVYGGTFGGRPVTGLDPNADPYGTGLSNLLTYAFFGVSRDPATVSQSELPKISPVDGSLHIAFTRPANVSGVIYGAEWSPTLDNDWQDLPDADVDPDTYEFSVPIEGGKKFMRLKVSEL